MCLYDSLVGLLQIRRGVLCPFYFPPYATVDKSVVRGFLNCTLHIELTAFVQRLMFTIFVAVMLMIGMYFALTNSGKLANWFAPMHVAFEQ